jgi:hypothetical protein
MLKRITHVPFSVADWVTGVVMEIFSG